MWSLEGLIWRVPGSRSVQSASAADSGCSRRWWGLRLGEGAFQRFEERDEVRVEVAWAEHKGLVAHQFREISLHVTGVGHARSSNQDGDDPDIACQASLDLQAHEVIGVIKAARSVCFRDCEPSVTDQCQEHVAGRDGVGDLLDEVLARFDRVYVGENLAAEAFSEPVIQPSSRVGRVAAGSSRRSGPKLPERIPSCRDLVTPALFDSADLQISGPEPENHRSPSNHEPTRGQLGVVCRP